MTALDDYANLARSRLARAQEFGTGAASRPVVSEPTAYGQAISIELATKAFLHFRGWSDDQTKTLRHDLVRTLYAAEAEGLEPDPDLRRLAEALNRFYRFHDWHAFDGEPADVLAGGAAVVARMLATVRAHVEPAARA